MNRNLKKWLVAASAGMLWAHQAGACAVCMGSKDAPIAPAVNASIVVLLVAIAAVGGSFFSFLIYLARRDNLSSSPGQELSGSFPSATPQQS